MRISPPPKHRQHKSLAYLFLFALICCNSAAQTITLGNQSPTSQQEALPIILSPNIIRDSEQFINGRKILAINNYSGPKSRRDVVSFVLLLQALRLGGYQGDIELHPEMAYLRNLNYASDGEMAIVGEPAWLSDIKANNDTLLISQAIIRQGEFVVGLYARPNHPLTLKTPTLKELRSHTAASSRNWKTDWQLLEGLQVKHIQHSLFWRNIVKMVYAGRADFTLAPFQAGSKPTLTAYGVTLHIVPGVKVAFSGSRHFVASHTHPMGPSAFKQLNTGIERLRLRGTIVRAYTEAGFFNKYTSGWKLLTPNYNPTADNP